MDRRQLLRTDPQRWLREFPLASFSVRGLSFVVIGVWWIASLLLTTGHRAEALASALYGAILFMYDAILDRRAERAAKR